MTHTTDTQYIYEGTDLELYVEAEFDWIPACGDGWNEPREPAHWEMSSYKLFRADVTREARKDINGLPFVEKIYKATEITPVPEIIHAIVSDIEFDLETPE